MTITLNPAAGQTLAARRVDVCQPGHLHTIRVSVERRWIDFSAGVVAGGSELVSRIRLEPGQHVFSFTPSSAEIHYDVRADEPGVRSLSALTYNTSPTLRFPTPYSGEQLRRLRFEQSGDVLWIWHPGYPWKALARRANRSWGLFDWRPNNGPFEAANIDETHTITPSGRSGQVTLTSNRDVFLPGHVGALWHLEHAGQFVTANLGQAGVFTDPIRVTGVGGERGFSLTLTGSFQGVVRLQRSVGNPFDWRDFQSYSSATVANVNDEFDNQIIFYRLAVAAEAAFTGTVTASLAYPGGSTVGVVRITEWNGFRQVGADVLQSLGATGATAVWAEGAWSRARGYPVAGALHDGRLWLVRGRQLWASQPDDFLSFAVGPNDDDAISRFIALGDISPASWIKGAAHLVIGTEGNEASVRSSSFEEALTPTNMTIRERSVRGSANVDAVRMGSQLFFVSRSGKRLIRLSYDVDAQGYADQDLTRLHEQVAGDGGFVGLRLQIEPEPRLWLVRDDGQAAILTFNQNENVVGWSRFVAADGEVQDVAILPGRPEDSVYLLVRREVAGEQRVTVERLQPERWGALSDAWFVQDGLDLRSFSPVRTISGLQHLNGVTAAIWADGQEHRPLLVQGGSVTLDRPVRRVIIGRGYVGRYASPRLAHGSQLGTSVGEQKRLNAATLLTSRTPRHAVRVGTSFERMTQRQDQAAGLVLDQAPSARTEEIRFEVEGRHETDPRLHIEMVGAGPALVLGYVPELQTYERNP